MRSRSSISSSSRAPSAARSWNRSRTSRSESWSTIRSSACAACCANAVTTARSSASELRARVAKTTPRIAEPAAGDRRFERRDERGVRTVLDEERALRILATSTRRESAARSRARRVYASHVGASAAIGIRGSTFAASARRAGPRPRRTRGSRRRSRTRCRCPARRRPRARSSRARLRRGHRVGGRGHGRDRVLEQGDARAAPVRAAVVSTTTQPSAMRRPVAVVEPEEARFGEAESRPCDRCGPATGMPYTGSPPAKIARMIGSSWSASSAASRRARSGRCAPRRCRRSARRASR